MSKFCLPYRAILSKLGLPIRKHDVAPASCDDIIPRDRYRKADIDDWRSLWIALRGW